KTMGFFIGYALSLFGRVQDRLTHVLVSEPFENNRDFFYPTQSPREIFNARGEPLDASQARVMLAEIPFVRLREGLPASLLAGQAGYSETVKAAQQRIVPPVGIAFDVKKRTVICGGVPVQMPPLNFAVYLWLARRAASGLPAVRPGEDVQAEEFLAVYREVVGRGSGDYDNACRALRHPEDFLSYFQEKRTNANKALKRVLGAFTAKSYLIDAVGGRLRTRYLISLKKEQIQLPQLGKA
ncbi:MAG TPA: TIGR02584 family CRISPR-associated protein, partial [Sutterella sp.]|nr:TIGR02584 family CRISPR-associated protein [Sutterella sp.]